MVDLLQLHFYMIEVAEQVRTYKKSGGFELCVMASSQDFIWSENLTVAHMCPVIMFLITVIGQDCTCKQL